MTFSVSYNTNNGDVKSHGRHDTKHNTELKDKPRNKNESNIKQQLRIRRKRKEGISRRQEAMQNETTARDKEKKEGRNI